MIWILCFLAVYLAILLAVACLSVHPPRIPLFLSPGGLGSPQREVEFNSKDGTILRGWWVEAQNATGVAVLSHGYLMNRSELSPVAHMLCQRGVSCLVYDFRAHGRSGGTVTTMANKEREDVAAAARFAKENCPGLKLALIGSSMGSAASALALADDLSLADALVLDSCFSRLSSASLGWWRFLGGVPLAVALAPVTLLAIPLVGFNPFRVDVAEALRKLSTKPVLFLHGNKDDLSLPKEAQRNHAAYGGEGEIVWFEGCGHAEGRWVQPELYNDSLLRFLQTAGLL